MTFDEKEVFRAAVEIYIDLSKRERGLQERARLRFQASEEAFQLMKHIQEMQIGDRLNKLNLASRISDQMIMDTFRSQGGSISRTARVLNLARQTITLRLKAIDPEYRQKVKNGVFL